MQKHHIGLGVLGIAIVVGAGFVLTRQPSEAEQPAPTPVAAAPDHANMPSGMPPMKMEPTTPPALTDEQTAEVAAGEAAHAPSKLTFDVHGGSFYFVPNMIKVKKGDTVTINFHNDGGFHDWSLDEFAIKIAHVADGAVGSATFVADKAGTFEYYCSVGHHREMGQKGTIVIE
jgi:plastocyanin